MTANLTAIASQGTTTAYVEMYAAAQGNSVVIVAHGIQYCPRTGENTEDILFNKVVESEDAENAGEDVQWIANDWLDAHKGRGWKWQGKSFAEAAFDFVYV